jgi:hypothetical protein
MDWKKWPEVKPESENEYKRTEMLISIPQFDWKSGKTQLKTIAAKWVNTTVRGKWVARWEVNDRISIWEPVYWCEMPEYKEEQE